MVRQWMVSPSCLVVACGVRLDFRGDATGAILGSTVDTCSASVSRDSLTNFTHFLCCGGLVSCSVSVLTQNGEVCSADASVLRSFWRCSHIEIWTLFLRRSVADSGCDDFGHSTHCSWNQEPLHAGTSSARTIRMRQLQQQQRCLGSCYLILSPSACPSSIWYLLVQFFFCCSVVYSGVNEETLEKCCRHFWARGSRDLQIAACCRHEVVRCLECFFLNPAWSGHWYRSSSA